MISNFCTLGWDKQPLISNSFISHLITPILKSLVVPVFNWCDLFTNCTIFFFKSHLFPNQREGYTKNQLDFKACFKVTNQIEGKWKTKSIMWQILQLLFPKLLIPPRGMNLISNQHQNGRNKVVIEPRVIQFWSRMNLSQRFKNKFHARQVEIS